VYFGITSKISMHKIQMYRRAKCNRNDVVKLHHERTTLAISFTLKVLRLYYTTNRVYLNQGDGSKQELKNYSVRNTQICIIYLFRPDKLVKEQSV